MCKTKDYFVTLCNVHAKADKKILVPEKQYNILNKNYNLRWSLYWSATDNYMWQNSHDLNKIGKEKRSDHNELG
jgi:hypothetical protein